MEVGWWGVLIAVLGGAIRIGTPFLFVSLGECLTEKSGRINLGLEGTLVMGAMTGYAVSLHSGSPWLGVLCAGLAGMALGALHSWLCSFQRVNDIAVGIAMMLFGTGLAFFLGKPYIQPSAPRLPSIDLGAWSEIPQLKAALQINALFLVGIVVAVVLGWMLKNTAWGLKVRVAGESADAARALGLPVDRIRILSTAQGGFLAGIGGSYLSLYYPFNWSEGLSSGQGLDGGGIGDLCPLAAIVVSLGFTFMGWSGRVGAILTISGDHRRILYLQRDSLHHDLGGDDHHLLSQTDSRGSST